MTTEITNFPEYLPLLLSPLMDQKEFLERTKQLEEAQVFLSPEYLPQLEETLYIKDSSFWKETLKKTKAASFLQTRPDLLDSLDSIVDIEEEPQYDLNVERLFEEYELKKKISDYFKRFKSVGSYGNIVRRYDSLNVTKRLPQNKSELNEIESRLLALETSKLKDRVIVFDLLGRGSYEAFSEKNIDWSTVRVGPAKVYKEIPNEKSMNTYKGSK